MIVDQEFRNLIPPLQPDELENLTDSLKRDGNRDPVVVWKETCILLDGHHRYDICQAHGIPLKPRHEISLPDRDAAKVWIIENQLGRRNLPPYPRILLVAKRHDILELRAKAKEREERKDFHGNQYVSGPSATLPKDQKIDTRKEIAKLADVGQKAVDKVRYIEPRATPEQKEKLNRGVATINQVYVELRRHEIREGLRFNPQLSPPIPGKAADILPLETVWPSPKGLILRQADNSVRLGLKSLKEWCLWRNPPEEVLAIPGVKEAIQKLGEALEEAKHVIETAAAELKDIAKSAPNTPIPWGTGPNGFSRDKLLLVNAQQKNMCGYCGVLGCWEAAREDGYCLEHAKDSC